MGINVQLRAENGDVLREILDLDMTLSRAARSAFAETRLLKYVVPWGDAVFNQTQAADLSRDIAIIRGLNPGSGLDNRLSEVQHLVDQLATKPHAYLCFVGD